MNDADFHAAEKILVGANLAYRQSRRADPNEPKPPVPPDRKPPLLGQNPTPRSGAEMTSFLAADVTEAWLVGRYLLIPFLALMAAFIAAPVLWMTGDLYNFFHQCDQMASQSCFNAQYHHPIPPIGYVWIVVASLLCLRFTVACFTTWRGGYKRDFWGRRKRITPAAASHRTPTPQPSRQSLPR